uniref:Uncharacterized protein n=1 Tax=Acrobeloides nanus TaxID=290746 RepID=A0A914E088_9BILA
MLGSEMGASLINALVSLTQVGNRDQFRRAFAAVTVNDVFNFLSYFILMPIEVGTGVIEKISGAIVQPLSGVKASEIKTLNFLTDPVLNYIIRALLGGQIGILVRKLMDKDLPWPFTCFTNYVVMVVGCVIVMIIQSSGVFRAVLTPLVGIGVVTLERLYPLLLGANVGTTFTGVLAAFSADPAKIKETLQMALAQTVYNLIGVILFYPIPFMRRIPINIAKKLANKTSKYRWFALIYIAVIFFILPIYLFGVSFLPLPIMLSMICIPLGFFAILILINYIQVKCPGNLPQKLRSWNFLPDYLHSLHPYDKAMTRYCTKISFCRKFWHRNADDIDLREGNRDMETLFKLSHQTQV